jgi:Nuclease-related domain
MIPDSPVDTDSNAERRLFDRLRDETPNEIVAFHSVAWQLPGEKGRPEQGESDFVLAHPDFGVLTLEVKGGTIRYDAQAGRWYSTGKKGENEIKDPGRQARNASHLLIKTLARTARGGGEAIGFGHAVAFPECRVPRKSLRPDLPRELVLDRADVDRLPDNVDRLFRHWFDPAQKKPLGAEGIERLKRVLANSFELQAPLAYEYEDERRQLMTLTQQQYRTLDLLARQTRVAIAGYAGSGKTFLAAEKARRLAAADFKVLDVPILRGTFGHYRVVRRCSRVRSMPSRPRTKGEPFTVRFDPRTQSLIEDEARRSKRSRTAIVEELADEALRTRRFPGIAFRDETPHRRAWVIGAGLDVWELCELLDRYPDSETVVAEFPLVEPRHCELALAYRRAYSGEVDEQIADNNRSANERLELAPFVRYAPARP